MFKLKDLNSGNKQTNPGFKLLTQSSNDNDQEEEEDEDEDEDELEATTKGPLNTKDLGFEGDQNEEHDDS